MRESGGDQREGVPPGARPSSAAALLEFLAAAVGAGFGVSDLFPGDGFRSGRAYGPRSLQAGVAPFGLHR